MVLCCYSKDSTQKRNTELLEIIYIRGNSAYDAFRQALIKTNAEKFLVEKLPNFNVDGKTAQGNRDETETVMSFSAFIKQKLFSRIYQVKLIFTKWTFVF